MSNSLESVTTLDEALRFMIDCFKAAGVCEQHAEIIGKNLLEADYRGHYSHGMNRLEMYINDIQSEICNPNMEPIIEKQTVSTAVVNGNNGLGAVVGNFCMDLAIEKASKTGIAIVTAHNSNHYGIAGIYALQAMKKGYIGLSFTNTSPGMVPTRAKETAIGTNPISLAAPALNNDSFVLDMATTTVAFGKVEVGRRKNQLLPEGWALDEQAKPTSNPEIAFKAQKLLPLGGTEITSGYKGFGLGILVEVLCGILSGSSYGPNIRNWGSGKSDKPANLGHCFIAIDPKCFTPGFEERMSDLLDGLRNLEPIDVEKPVLIPGDPERSHMELVKQNGGLKYVKNQHETNLLLAKRLKVDPMKSVYKSLL